MKKCKVCKKEYSPHNKSQRFCGYICLGQYNKKRVWWECTLCHKGKYRRPCRARDRKYCPACTKINQKGSGNGNWKGGRKIVKGYIYLWVPNHPFSSKNYVAEHRLVMERHLDRYLKLEENVHHINGNRSDNRKENLKIFINSEHAKLHSTGRFISRRYFNCSFCKKRFWRTRSQIIRSKFLYCSHKCHSIAQKNEYRKRINGRFVSS